MSENKANAISVSLMNRKIYAVRFTGLDPLASFHDALHNARRLFFEHGKTVHIRENGVYNGLAGEVRGKLNRRGFTWQKKTGKQLVEAAFVKGSQRGVEFYAPNGALHSRMYLDREQHWLRSEYFSPDDGERVKVCFKPDDARDAVIRFDYNYSTGKTKETMLFPVPYAFQTAEQSLQNASCGDELLLIADSSGEYAYCPRDEQQRRIRFIKSNKDASVMLSMGWEVRDGDIASAQPDPEESVLPEGENPMGALLDNLFEDVHREAEAALAAANQYDDPKPAPAEENPAEIEEAPAEESAPETDEKPAEEPTETPADENVPEPVEEPVEGSKETPVEEIEDEPTAEPAAEPVQLEAPHAEAAAAHGIAVIRNGWEINYRGGLENGLRSGFGRTESETGVTLYEGEYKNDLRDGFGAHHYKSGAISYVGDFKEDKRDGFGVSFRESDHALHVSRWTDGKPEGYAALFDPNGAMRFAGKIIDGKKQGAGVSIDAENDTVFVAKFENGEMTGEGALFAGDGTLLYVGGWENGKRHGRGTEFDKTGDVVYSGEWRNDRYQNGILYKRVQPEEQG